MELPKPPDDFDLKNIIDKLANFVARNGPDFEQMTKQKQKDNAKFSFLFGGEHFNYYQYRVTTEQAIINQQKQKMAQQQQQHMLIQPPPVQTAPWQPPGPPPNAQLLELDQQLAQHQQQMEAQIKQSEQNLAAQYQSLIQQQQVEIEEAIQKKQHEKMVTLSKQCELEITELDNIVQPIISSCTKEAISNGKNWIFTHNITPEHGNLICIYLRSRIVDKNAPFELRLYLIYLINDVLHHCTRKGAEDLKNSIESIVIPVFCTAHVGTDVEKQLKLTKLLLLWEKNKYFDVNVLEQMKDPSQALSNYQASLITEHADIVTHISNDINERYGCLQKQHQEFVSHINTQLQQQTQQIQQQRQRLLAAQVAIPPPGPQAGPLPPPPGPGLPGTFDPTKPPPNFSQPPPGFNQPPPPQQFDYGHGQAPPVVHDYGHGHAPLPLPDLSKPPPGFPPQPPTSDVDLMPSVPYFDLPAGLMAPLVKLEDHKYIPLDPKDIRLPPPCPPNERLLAAVEAFYSPPCHERPRDAEGWEKLGLFEFFKAKSNSKKISGDQASPSRSRSPSSSSSDSESRSKSRSPPPRRRRRTGYSRSRSRSASPLPYQRRSKSRSPPSRRRQRSQSPLPYRKSSRSRSRSMSPVRRGRRSRSRSETPPHMIGFQHTTSLDSRIGGENKGHMLMKKMGWSGAGLGAEEQGRIDPVEQGDVRDRMDMYKGVGMNMKDPFEQFRKNRSQTFIQRMKARTEEPSGSSSTSKTDK